MSEKTAYKLTIAERLQLLNVLPPQGDIITIKIIRKLRETLSPNEQEHEEYGFVHEYICQEPSTDGQGKPRPCNFKVTSQTPSRCPHHNTYMVPTGMVFWNLDMTDTQKEIWLSNKSKSIIAEALKKLNDQKQLLVEQEELYEKFVTPDATEDE